MAGKATIRPMSPGDSVASPISVTSRLPRDGPSVGGGSLRVYDRVVFERQVRDVSTPIGEAPAGIFEAAGSKQRPGHFKPSSSPKSSKGTPESKARSNANDFRTSRSTNMSESQPATASPDTPRSSANNNYFLERNVTQKLSPEERKRLEIQAKWEKTEALRKKDHKNVMEHLERQKEMRDVRFKRLLENVTGRDNLAYKTAIALREREAHEDRRRRELYAEWDSRVYQPLARQCHAQLNPPDRGMVQLLAGSKSVEFTLPDSPSPRLSHNVQQCPVSRPLLDNARENAFHQAATAVLGHSHSAPCLPGGQEFTAGRVLPRALTRPLLDPTSYSQVQFQGTIYGHFAQMAEVGPGAHRGKRGGPDVFIPDESDGVEAAGTKSSRTAGRGHKGILHGDAARLGEASVTKSAQGSSSAAPNQDHYTFERGTRVVAMEFPLGKKIFPGFH